MFAMVLKEELTKERDNEPMGIVEYNWLFTDVVRARIVGPRRFAAPPLGFSDMPPKSDAGVAPSALAVYIAVIPAAPNEAGALQAYPSDIPPPLTTATRLPRKSGRHPNPTIRSIISSIPATGMAPV